MRTYYMLTKPGIIMGNLITMIGGFALASKGIQVLLFLEMLVGLGLVIASACVCNNYIDRVSDLKMQRTKNRPLAQGVISPQKALLFALILGVLGVTILTVYTNLLSVAVALIGFLIYVVGYSITKYHTTYATLLGSISGAVPPVVGYTVASHRLDMGAFLLFLILVLWQMPHFYSIAVYRFDDYKAASIPVLPIASGIYTTKVHMVLYIIAFTLASSMLTVLGYTGYLYLSVAILFGLSWLVLCMKGFKATSDYVWARQMFVLSLAIITGFSAMISFL